jgi:hypothetical protein
MKTDDLVTMLATGAGAVEVDPLAWRCAMAIGWGALGATLLLALMLGVRQDIGRAALEPMFWVKLGYVACLAVAGLFALSRLSLPGRRLTGVPAALATPPLLIGLLALIALGAANPNERQVLLFGKTWTSCPLMIAALSVPMLVAVTWAIRGLAPTRLSLAGGAAGLASGAIGAIVYSLHCQEMEAPFLATWYSLGMLIPTAIGALLGPRLLRW